VQEFDLEKRSANKAGLEKNTVTIRTMRSSPGSRMTILYAGKVLEESRAFRIAKASHHTYTDNILESMQETLRFSACQH
jgi:ABC-type antimicrobial peptide transport system ATPase subunit